MSWLGTFAYFRIETIYRHLPSRDADARNRLRGGRPRGDRVRLPGRSGDGDLGAGVGPPPELRPRGPVGHRARLEAVHRPRGPLRPGACRAGVSGARAAGRDRAPRRGGDRGVAPRGEPRSTAGGQTLHEPRGLSRVPARPRVPEARGSDPGHRGPSCWIPYASIPPPRAGPRAREEERGREP